MTTEDENKDAIDAATETSDATADESTQEAGADATAAATTSEEGSETTVGGASALFIGVSRPEDEYGATGRARPELDDEELAKMGVEPDSGPNSTLIATFAGLTIAVTALAIFAAMLFIMTSQAMQSEAQQVEQPLVTAAQGDAAAVLEGYNAHDESGYSVPIDVAMDLVVERPQLLAQHPMGVVDVTEPPPPPPPVVEGSGEAAPADAAAPAAGN